MRILPGRRMLPREWGLRGVRSSLVALVLVAVLPLLAFATVAVVRLALKERDALSRGARDTARAFSVMIDDEVETSMATLRALTASPELTSGDLAGFARQVERVRTATQAVWSLVDIVDASGRPSPPHWGPSAVGLGSVVEGDFWKDVVTTGRPVVSNLIPESPGQEPSIAIAVPALRDDRVTHVLAASLEVQKLAATLARQRISEGWAVRLLDRNKVTILHVPVDRSLVGQPATGEFLSLIRSAPEGWGRVRAPAGIPTYVAYAQSNLTGWTLGVSMPAAIVESSLGRFFWTLVAAGLGLLTLGILFALLVGRRIARPIQELSRAADALGRGETPSLHASGLREVDAVGRAIAEAARVRSSADTARDDLLRREQAARADAETQSRAKDAFLATLGHELRNPLAAIRAAATILEEGGPAEAARVRSILTRQTRHLARLVEDLLDVTRLSSGRIALRREAVDLGAAVWLVVEALRESGRTAQHDLEVAVSSVPVDADPVRLEQIVWNLVDNALKYTPPGGRIRVAVARDDGAAVLSVRDGGVGIAPELLARIFDPFVKAEPSLDRAQSGLGIGLSLVRGLVELHGGAVTVSSGGLGCGSEFVVRLPALARAPAGEPAANEPLEVVEATPRRVLLVEDNDDARRSLRALLELWGHQVLEARDGDAGVATALATHPDVALIDIGLPGLDGYAVAHRLRLNRGADRVTLIALTGYGQPGDRLRAMEAGFDAYLVKPVAPDELRWALARARRGPVFLRGGLHPPSEPSPG